MDKSLREFHLLVVSDLHLSEGRDGNSKKFSKNEDFFVDEEFASFLAYYQDQRRWNGAKWHLIVNGDFLDFLQVITPDGTPSVLPSGSNSSGRGLPCGEHETVLKLRKIADGHWQFFEALAGFVGIGNLLTVIKGNHDVEFHYPSVRAAFLAELQAAFGRRLQRDPAWGKDKDIRILNGDTVQFSDWFYFEPKLLWVEHGNRYEGFNSFKYWLSPLLPVIPGWPHDRKDEIDLPFGSLFVRYLFNNVEVVEPFADNIKPATRFVWWLIWKHPTTALRFIFTEGRRMLDRIRRAWMFVSPKAWEERKQQHNSRLVELSRESGIELSKLEALDRLRAPSILKEPNSRAKFLRFLLRPCIFLPGIALLVAAVVLSVLFVAAKLLVDMIPAVAWEMFFEPFVELVFPLAPWAVLFVTLAGLILFFRWLITEERKQGPSYLNKRAARIAELSLLGVQYVIMGHTHDAELHTIGEDDGRIKEYFNTGTWTTVFSEEERLIRKPIEFVFVQGLRVGDGLTLKLLEWSDAPGEPRLIKLFRNEKNAE
jgi:UDP-2,3-diacylglucosamine pyrophosphatase LpxH